MFVLGFHPLKYTFAAIKINLPLFNTCFVLDFKFSIINSKRVSMCLGCFKKSILPNLEVVNLIWREVKSFSCVVIRIDFRCKTRQFFKNIPVITFHK